MLLVLPARRLFLSSRGGELPPGTEVKTIFKKPGFRDRVLVLILETGRDGRTLAVREGGAVRERLPLIEGAGPGNPTVLRARLEPVPPP